jgi:hypothetical protein
VKRENHWLRSVKLPAAAIHHAPMCEIQGGKIVRVVDEREVTVTAIDTHGAIIRRKGCGRYYAPLEELLPDWEDSKGARSEVAYALDLGKPVKKLVGGDA